MNRSLFLLLFASLVCLNDGSYAGEKTDMKAASLWPQWRGPSRDGQVAGPTWPDRLTEDSLTQLWRVPFGPSYSGPIVSGDLVFTTETKNKETEVVYALDRKTGKECWRAEWKGAMTVPFFAASNGSWIRSTPAYDGERLYVAGMRDVLVCLDAKTGKEQWRYDFVQELKTPLPDFGFVCSPLIDGEFVYVQAGASITKLDKKNGKIMWRALEDKGGMYGSAFSSPVVATVAGKRQLLVQTREKLAGVDLQNGDVLWSQVVPAFRGMNILTPLTVGDDIFTSSYQNKSWLFRIGHSNEKFSVTEAWSNKLSGYMSSPVVIKDHVYLHLQNQRFACVNLRTGENTWTSKSFGKYCSMVVNGDRILALDQRGILLLIKANPKEFELIDSLKVSEEETWAHLAVSGDELFIRELNSLASYRWRGQPGSQSADNSSSVSRLSPGDLDFLMGKWAGELEYLDFKDNQSRQKIKAMLHCDSAQGTVTYEFSYVKPNGKTVAGDPNKLRLAEDGRHLFVNDEPWIVAAKNIDTRAGKFRVVLSRDGTDNNKSAKLRRTLMLDGESLTIRTEVQHDTSDKPLVRNEYVLKKQ